MTTLADHADDTVALMRALSLEPAAVVSQSAGALITADLVARHPGAVRSAVLFEAPLFGIVPGNEGVIANPQRLVAEKMTSGGPRAAMEAFMRANAGDDVYDAFRTADPETLERYLDNGAHFLRVELPAVARFTPNVTTIKSSGVPLTVLLGSDNRDTWYGKAATWLAAQLGTSVVQTPGGHAAMWTHAVEFAAAVRRTRGLTLGRSHRPRYKRAGDDQVAVGDARSRPAVAVRAALDDVGADSTLSAGMCINIIRATRGVSVGARGRRGGRVSTLISECAQRELRRSDGACTLCPRCCSSRATTPAQACWRLGEAAPAKPGSWSRPNHDRGVDRGQRSGRELYSPRQVGWGACC